MPKHADPRRAGLPRRRETKSIASETPIPGNATGDEITEVSKPAETLSPHPLNHPEETEATAELAQARANQATLESAHTLLVEEENATAAERFARLTRDRFVADRAAWLADPTLNLPIFGSTFEGAKYLASLWADFAEMLAPGAPGPTFEQFRQAAAALGSRWQVAQVSGDGAWIMARYVRSSADPESVIARWIKESGTPDDTLERAAWHMRHAPAGIDAQAELARRAAAESDIWKAEAARLQARAEASRTAMIETSVGTGSADPSLEKRFRLLNRLLAQARSRTEKLQRRLDTLKKQRAAEARKAGKRPANEMQPTNASRISTEVSMPDQAADSNLVQSTETPQADCECQMPIGPNLPQNLQHECNVDSKPENPLNETMESSLSTNTEMQVGADSGQRERLLKGLSRFRRIDWSDPHSIAPEDVEVITNLRNLPDSLRRDTIVRLTFGSEKVLGKAWRQYLRWRDEFEPMGVASASFED